MSIQFTPDAPATRRAFNRLAREKMKLRLLADIRMDLMVCLKPLWQDRILVLLTHKKELANEIHTGPNPPAELLECYSRLDAAFDDVVNAEIKFRLDS